jgi:hypothetical protein
MMDELTTRIFVIGLAIIAIGLILAGAGVIR